MELLTTKETAAILKISTKSLYRLFTENKMQYIKVGRQIRVSYNSLEQYINANTQA